MFRNYYLWVQLILLTTLSVFNAFGQDQLDESSRTKHQYDLVQAMYGTNQILVNGVFFEDIYKYDLGHPFYEGDNLQSLQLKNNILRNVNNYQDGYIVINNIRYDNIKLKYNINNQTVVVLYEDKELSVAYLPPVVLISEFSINNQIFLKHQFNDEELSFYQEIYKGKLNCYSKWEKKKVESHHNKTFKAHKYSEQRKLVFIEKNNEIYRFKATGSFLRLFAKEHRKEIKGYMSSQKIRIKKSTNEDIVKLLSYCDSLTETHEPLQGE